jgi:hypothetical protein
MKKLFSGPLKEVPMATSKPKSKSKPSKTRGGAMPPHMSAMEAQLWEVVFNASAAMFIGSAAHVNGVMFPIDATWKAVQEALHGAYLEPVRLRSGNMLIVDEEGLLKHLAWNSVATSIAMSAGVEAIVGDAVFVPKHLVRKVLG